MAALTDINRVTQPSAVTKAVEIHDRLTKLDRSRRYDGFQRKLAGVDLVRALNVPSVIAAQDTWSKFALLPIQNQFANYLEIHSRQIAAGADLSRFMEPSISAIRDSLAPLFADQAAFAELTRVFDSVALPIEGHLIGLEEDDEFDDELESIVSLANSVADEIPEPSLEVTSALERALSDAFAQLKDLNVTLTSLADLERSSSREQRIVNALMFLLALAAFWD